MKYENECTKKFELRIESNEQLKFYRFFML